MEINFDNSYSQLPERFFERTSPSPSPGPKLLAFNNSLGAELGIDVTGSSESDLAQFFSGTAEIAGSAPLAMAYAGHQFGNFVPQLGDGRAHLLGEVVSPEGNRFDIQLKGSGITKFSRGGDGRSPLGPVIREYIVSEAMHALGIPTTRALAAVATGEQVHREETLPGGVFTRVASSHLRVGTFEFFMRQGDIEGLKTLFNYAVQRHFPEIDSADESAPVRFLEALSEKIATLVAKWMSVGFIHGVMNTDNTSVAGITIDYGPCAFMDDFSFERVFSFIDRRGRYAFGNQARIALWNLERFAECMIPLIKGDEQTAISQLTPVLEQFSDKFENAWINVHRPKFGFKSAFPGEMQLYQEFFAALQQHQLDFTLSFKKLEEDLHAESLPYSTFIDTELNEFVSSWRSKLTQNEIEASQALTLMAQSNPVVIPRNHLVEEAIREAYKGNTDLFIELNKCTLKPYTIPDKKNFLTPPKAEEKIKNTFCGT